MRAKAGIIIIICVLFMVGTAGAAVGIPDTVVVTTDKSWIIANNVDQSNITITVLNTTPPYNGNVQGVDVNLAVDPLYGTLSRTTVTTDSSGMNSSTFKVKTKSGTANITATVAGVLPATQYQKIDHDSPYSPLFEYPFVGTVATEVPFNVSITDRWGNRIDDRKQVISSDVHTISLHIDGPPPNDCGFAGNITTHDISKTLDSNGNTTVMVKLTSTYGPNTILMNAFGSIPDQWEWILADTRGVPFSITQVYDPDGSPPQLPADGVTDFTIKYMVYDRFGQPTKGQNLTIVTDYPGDPAVVFPSNSIGQVWFTYGHKSFTGDYNITATAVNNNSVTISKMVKFFNTSAEFFEVTANPSQMGSLDANSASHSDVSAKVIDIMGNPVGGEPVTFSLGASSFPGGPYNSTSPPVLLNTTAITNTDGIATVQFIPGAFSKDIHIADYRSSATGTCQVNVMWNGNSKPVTLTWKNYPYLSVITSVSPKTVKLNETVDVNIKLYGDGFALGHNPIDAMLVIDRSGSMGYTMPGTTHTKMYYAKQAATSFVNQMTASTDQIGLVSYSDNSGIDYVLSNNFPGVRGKIANLSTGGGTNTRTGFKQAIGDVVARRNGDPKSVQAVILMTDGQYNQDGDPLARGVAETTEWYMTDGTTGYYQFPAPFAESQDMSAYAKKYNIRLYTITFGLDANQVNSTDTYNAMTLLSANTNGTHYHANTGSQLNNVYTDIAGQLKTEAGVDTQMVLDYGTIIVNNVTDTSGEVFSYVPDPPTLPSHAPGSTWIHKFNQTHESINNITDQSANWTAYKQLDFNVGTVNLNETWEATFRLKVLKEGNINIFGPNSFIKFTDSTGTGITSAPIPPAYFTGSQTLNMTGMTMKTTSLLNLRCTEPGEIKALLPVAWTTSYDGISPAGVRETVSYSVNNAPYVQFAEITGIPPGVTSQQAQLDITKLPPGGYQIKVVATAEDTPDTYALLTEPKTVGGRGVTFIKIE